MRRMLIERIEDISGRNRLARLYGTWSRSVAPTGRDVFSEMLRLVEMELRIRGAWPLEALPEGPLVVVANHPFGIADGIAILALAEALGRPFRILIHSDLTRIPEIRPYALPVDFAETRVAQAHNLATRKEALRLLKEGVTVAVFPAGGVSTAPRGIGRACDLEWKLFPARLVRDAQASVLPVHFSGQNSPIFHIASRFSATLRTSLLVPEFARRYGRPLDVAVGAPIPWQDLERFGDRKALLRHMQQAVLSLAAPLPARRRVRLWQKAAPPALAERA